MCICHLPCRHLRNQPSPEQVRTWPPEASGRSHPPSPPQASGRLRAHYHCVVCSVTIARKTDMVSHLKRHVNKGETEASYLGASERLRQDAGQLAAAP